MIPRFLRSKLRSLSQRAFHLLPLNKRRIVFSSFGGRGYSDSPKYLHQYLSTHLPDFEFVWALRDPSTSIEGPGQRVRYGSAKHLFLLATSKYWISNARLPSGLLKRSGVVYLQTWHGTALKKLGLDVSSPQLRGPRYEDELRNQVRDWDHIVSPNPHTTRAYQSAFGLPPSKIWEVGYPRNDLLFRPHSSVELEMIRNALDLPAGKKVILYTPTWRDNARREEGKYRFEPNLDLPGLKEQFGESAVLLLRGHYHHEHHDEGASLKGFLFDVSQYPDIQKLYLISDLLIADYSSTTFDFALLRRPIVLHLPDLDEYQNMRGVYFDPRTLGSGAVSSNHGQLVKAISDALNQEPGSYSTQRFYDAFCSSHDGHSCQKIAERLFDGLLLK